MSLTIPVSIFLSSLVGRDESLLSVLDTVVDLEQRGIHAVWASDGLRTDSLGLLALAASRTERIGLGTAIVQTWPRHPIVVAQQAQLVNAVSDGRLRLGLGPGHAPSMAATYGYGFDRPLSHVREYVQIVRALLQDGAVDVDGERFHAHATLRADGLGAPVLISALSEQMCRLAGSVADGVIVWLAPPSYVASTVAPMVREGAARAGRPAPAIIAGAPATVADDAQAVRDTVRATFGVYPSLPFYAALFRKAGLAGSERALEDGWSDAMVDAVIPSGGESRLAERVEEYRLAGADEVLLAPFAAGRATVGDTLDALTALSGAAP